MPGASPHRHAPQPLWWILPIVFVIGLLSMPQEEYVGDPKAVRCETVSLINNGSLEIPPDVVTEFGGKKGQYFFQNPTNNKWYCKWGILNGLINAPPLLVEKWCEGSLPYLTPSRAIYLNFLNLTFALASAVYLSLIVARYTKSALVITCFVLTAFYCTYWWNYLRAQNSETYQTLFMLAYYYHLVSNLRLTQMETDPARDLSAGRHVLMAGIFLGVLILVKTVHVLAAPVGVLLVLYFEWKRLHQQEGTGFFQIAGRLTPTAARFIGPLVVAIALLLAIDDYKFGSPLTTGFEQWGPEANKSLFAGSMLRGLYAMFFSLQGSAFLCFPLLFLALFGYPHFLRCHLAEGLLIFGSGAPVILVAAQSLTPLGQWAYGPRYLVVFLGLLSLPFIFTLEFLLHRPMHWWRVAGLAAITLMLGYSFKLQMNVNALPFFTFYQLQAVFGQLHDPQIDAYFETHTYGTINGDFLAYKNGNPFPPLEMARPHLDPESLDRLTQIISQLTPSNYYWWPDAPNAGNLLR